jgi:hypothetical protein
MNMILLRAEIEMVGMLNRYSGSGMEDQSYTLRGNICYSKDKNHLEIVDKGYIVCVQHAYQLYFSSQ